MRALFNGDSPSMAHIPVEPVIVTGTSAGSFNAALLCSVDPDADGMAALDYLEDVWLNAIPGNHGCGNNVLRIRGSPVNFFREDCLRNDPDRARREFSEDLSYLGGEIAQRSTAFTSSDGNLQQRLLDVVDIGILLSADRFVQVVKETVNLYNVRRSTRVLRIAATNWRTGVLRIFANHEMTDEWGHNVILASSAIPGVFPPVEVAGEPYADGGLVANTPLRPAIDAGADTLHVIYMDPYAEAIPLPRYRSTFNTVYRLAVIALAAMMNRDIEIAKRVNRGIDVMEGLAAPDENIAYAKGHHHMLSRDPQKHVIAPYRRVAIHRYHPHEDPGGTLRWLDFDRDRILHMMERGYRDAAGHDCIHRECLLLEI
jgi:predicted acylesterase/phospholipase RssA